MSSCCQFTAAITCHILVCWCLYCSGSNILLSTYRDKEDALNYIAAGGLCYSRLNTSSMDCPIVFVNPCCASIRLDLLIALFLGLRLQFF